MTAQELKTLLADLGLSQADFARLLGVTSRAVNLWTNDDREIPGPAEAYLRLYRILPANLRQVELARLRERGSKMRDGMYGISFRGQQGSGQAVLVVDSGCVYGADSGGARYDGTYMFRDDSNSVDIAMKVTFPAHGVSVFGISNPYEWAIDVTTNLSTTQSTGHLKVKTSLGSSISAQFEYLRPLPSAG